MTHDYDDDIVIISLRGPYNNYCFIFSVKIVRQRKIITKTHSFYMGQTRQHIIEIPVP